MNASNRICKLGFIGSGQWSSVYLNCLTKLQECNLDIVLTMKDLSTESKNTVQSFPSTVYYNSKVGYHSLRKNRLHAIIMAGWPYKIPDDVIYSVGCPIINIHASLLPRYRGPEPIIQMLLHNEKEGGVTLHKVDSNWDSGPICAQNNYYITETDNNRTLFFKAGRIGQRLLRKIIDNILHDNLVFVEQNEYESSYYPKIDISQYIFDESKSINDVFKITRAFTGQYPLIGKSKNGWYLIHKYKIVRAQVREQEVITLKDGFIFLEKFESLETIQRLSF